MSVTRTKKAAKAAPKPVPAKRKPSSALKAQLEASIADEQLQQRLRKAAEKAGPQPGRWTRGIALDPEDAGTGIPPVTLEGIAIDVMHTWLDKASGTYLPTLKGVAGMLWAIAEASKADAIDQKQLCASLGFVHSIVDRNQIDLDYAIDACRHAIERKIPHAFIFTGGDA